MNWKPEESSYDLHIPLTSGLDQAVADMLHHDCLPGKTSGTHYIPGMDTIKIARSHLSSFVGKEFFLNNNSCLPIEHS